MEISLTELVLDFSVFRKKTHALFDLGHVHFEIFVPFEFCLHGHNIFGVPDFAIVHRLKVLLELVKFSAQFFPFSLDTSEALLSILV